VIRIRGLLLTAVPILLPNNPVGIVSINVAILMLFMYWAILVRPYAYLRNNNVNVVGHLCMLGVLFIGVCFTTDLHTAARLMLSVGFMLLVTWTVLVMTHAILYELVYFTNEKLCERPWLAYIIKSRVVRALLHTHRSYATDFKRHLENQLGGTFDGHHLCELLCP